MSTAAAQALPGYRPSRPRPRSRRGTVAGTIGMTLLTVGLAVGTLLEQEATTLAIIVASMLLVVVCVRPPLGIMLLIVNYLFASYPTPIRGGGLLTINNVLGVILAVILAAELMQRPDFWFLNVRQVQIYMAIAGVLVLGTFASYWTFPDLRITWGKVRTLDQTAELSRDFVTRFAFILLSLKFLTTRRHIKIVITLMLMCLILTVPSALLGWASGDAEGGRAAASFSIGTNANRLAFLCLMQAAFWWYLGRTVKSKLIQTIIYGIIATLVLTVFATASRSGFLGLCLLLYLLSGRRGNIKGNRLQIFGLALIAGAIMLTVIPQENLERIENLNPLATGHSENNIGTHSTERRVETIELGWQIFTTYPLFGVGLGNFREVARQVYNDPFYRPPHDSYIWSLSEGGIFCFILFLYLFWVTIQDVRWIQRSPATPDDLQWIAVALEPSFYLLMFYSIFADMWLSPVTYILIIIVMIMKRYVSCRRVVLA